jgi:hypothetical protein
MVVLQGEFVVARRRDEVEPPSISAALRGALEARHEERAEQRGLPGRLLHEAFGRQGEPGGMERAQGGREQRPTA